uniref:TPT domain-containing protein n=1 Tax=Angiostrongylus cantonensis TaxID=6313 RepID=A0A0K0DL33_ANGCA
MGIRFNLTPSLRFKLRVVTICLCWYAVSSASSITNKVVLQSYPYPITLALSNLMWVPVFSIPFLRMWEYKIVKLTSMQYNKYLTPISAGKAIAAVSAYFSLWKVPVSYAHTVKASMPLFSVFLSRVILKETQSKRVYLSLLPIVAGVVVASATELSFSFFGMFSALLSTFTYSLLNILVKKLLKESDMHPIRLLAMNSQLAAIIVFPFWLFNDAFTMTRSFGSNDASTPSPDLWLLYLLSMSGALSFLQNVCAFALIHELTALSYAVCNATKRITVIGSSLAKQADKVESHSLPLTRSHTVLSESTIVALDSGENNDVMYWYVMLFKALPRQFTVHAVF